MKTLYSCGCSFMTVDTRTDFGITSFLDLYCAERSLKHVSLGRSGATNFLIRTQIEEAINCKADYIVVGTTTSDRMDIPIPTREKDIQWPVKLSDVEYKGYRSASAENIRNPDPKVISDSINNWTTDNYTWVFHDNVRRTEVTEAQITAMKHYVAELHNFQLETTRDYYIIAEGIRKLMMLGKQFKFMTGPMSCDWSWVGDNLYSGKQPWDMPMGLHKDSANHNGQEAHDLFAQLLADQTPTWTND